MISNPVTLFAGGGDSEHLRRFTYKGGKYLYHFSPYDNGLSRSLECNIVFFANDEQHAFKVLERMFRFVVSCHRKQIRYYKKNPADHSVLTDQSFKRFSGYLKALQEGKITITKAPTNQFYKVGWASNDTL